jgi:two-component system, cell cycle response regulator DivK
MRLDQMQRSSMSTTRRPVVLLVQPSRDDGLEMYAEFLRYHGLAVIPVSDTRDALMLAPQADIVVTGITLDDPTDGVDLVSRLRHDDGTRSMPLIVLTACAWPKDRARAEGAGCDVFLPKPIACWAKCGNCSRPHVHERPTHRTSFRILRLARRDMRTDPMRLIGCPGQWRGHRDGDINERKEALYGPPGSQPIVTRAGDAQSVGERDRVRHRPPCVRAIPCP